MTSNSSSSSSIPRSIWSPWSALAPMRCGIFIDHPGGVDLALCERVTKHLSHLMAGYSLEVSSPGPKYRGASHVPETKEQLQ